MISIKVVMTVSGLKNNIAVKAFQYIKNKLEYNPPIVPNRFILGEPEERQEPSRDSVNALRSSQNELEALIQYAHKLEEVIETTRQSLAQGLDAGETERLKTELKTLEKQKKEVDPVLLAYDAGTEPAKRLVSANLAVNKKLIETLYHVDINKDILIREFEIPGKNPVKAMLVFLDGMIDKQLINLAVLQPLMLLDGTKEADYGEQLVANIIERYLPSNQAKRVNKYSDVMDSINSGDSALFIDGIAEAVLLATKGYAQRGVDRPQVEQSVHGIQAAFSEGLRTNTGLIRTLLPSNDLVTEIVMVGDRVPQRCAIMYFSSLANETLVSEIRRRIKHVSTDHILNLGILEQFIEDPSPLPFPQTLSTERPDRAAVHLLEGRIAILYEGVPLVSIAPVSFFTFFHSVEDFTFKIPAGNFMRLLRLVGALLSVILPSLYLSISYFHQEALPTELALAVAGAREKVPFPAIVEVLLMEMAFELIREAGLRIPGILGSTIGIVGAIIIGQAAVAANIVSPIVVVIIALTGLASFSIPDYRLAFSLRLTRFVFLFLATTFGLVGLAIGLLIFTTLLCSMKSYGVPYMSPVTPKTVSGPDVVLRGPVFNQDRRPDAINPKDGDRQPHISRKWHIRKPARQEENDE